MAMPSNKMQQLQQLIQQNQDLKKEIAKFEALNKKHRRKEEQK